MTTRVWTCDHCGRRGTWGRGWRHAPGIESGRNKHPGGLLYPWVTCSKACEMATDFGLSSAEPSCWCWQRTANEFGRGRA